VNEAAVLVVLLGVGAEQHEVLLQRVQVVVLRKREQQFYDAFVQNKKRITGVNDMISKIFSVKKRMKKCLFRLKILGYYRNIGFQEKCLEYMF
jgi:hypothetical protein